MESLKNEKVETSKTDFLSKLQLDDEVSIVRLKSDKYERGVKFNESLHKRVKYKERFETSPLIRHTIVDISVPDLDLDGGDGTNKLSKK